MNSIIDNLSLRPKNHLVMGWVGTGLFQLFIFWYFFISSADKNFVKLEKQKKELRVEEGELATKLSKTS
jgi:hypothetical protein